MQTAQTVNPLLPPPMGVTGNCGGVVHRNTVRRGFATLLRGWESY